MTRFTDVIVPEIDNEVEFRCPPDNWDYQRFFFEEKFGQLQINLKAIDLYYQYMIEKLAGLTEKTADEWIKDKV